MQGSGKSSFKTYYYCRRVKYIDSLKNDDTDLIEEDIPAVLSYLFTNYGKVPTRVVKEKEQEVLTAPFVPNDSMITIYPPIEQLRPLADIAGIPYTETQVVDFGVQLIKSTRDFETALGEWNRKPQTEKSWKNSKLISKTHSRRSKT